MQLWVVVIGTLLKVFLHVDKFVLVSMWFEGILNERRRCTRASRSWQAVVAHEPEWPQENIRPRSLCPVGMLGWGDPTVMLRYLLVVDDVDDSRT